MLFAIIWFISTLVDDDRTDPSAILWAAFFEWMVEIAIFATWLN